MKRKLLTAGLILAIFSPAASAHCDTMDGPLIADARQAIETGDVNYVLIWVKPEKEQQVISLFRKTLSERKRGAMSAARADKRFFEAVVRIHRKGEGASYSGIKPAGTPVEPAIAAADSALESGSVEPLIAELITKLSATLRSRYAHVQETKLHMRDSLEAGRAYVEAYVSYMHYAEGLAAAIESEEHSAHR